MGVCALSPSKPLSPWPSLNPRNDVPVCEALICLAVMARHAELATAHYVMHTHPDNRAGRGLTCRYPST